MALLAPFSLGRPFYYNLCFRNPAFRHFASQHLDLLKAEKCWHVSSHGRCCDTRGRISQGYLHGSGYSRINILEKVYYVHRVVAISFLGPPSEHAWQVHHRDSNPANNCVDNLEYVLPRQNVAFSFANGTREKSQPLLSKPVLWRHIGSNQWTHSASISSAARHLGLSLSTISRCCHSHSAAKGIEFRLADMHAHDLPGEEWRPMLDSETGSKVPGRMVSSLGRIRSCHGKIHRGHLSKLGYYTTQVSLQGASQKKGVHRLVAFAFLGHPPTGDHTQVNHKDGDKSNNVVQNLEYVTPSQNSLHHHSLARSNGSGSPSRKPVWSRAVEGNQDWQWHESMSHAAATFGLHQSSISKCCSGSARQARGFEFRTADPANTAEVIEGEEWRRVDVSALLRDKAVNSAKQFISDRKCHRWKPELRHYALGYSSRCHSTDEAI